MKKRLLLPVLMLMALFTQSILAQNDAYVKEIEDARKAKDLMMADPATSPIAADQLEKFDSLAYFPIDEKYKVEGMLSADESPRKETLKTNTGARKKLMMYGTVTFSFEGKSHTLKIYRNDNLPEFGENNTQFFIPFFDKTSGDETNPNGRYLPVNIIEGKNKVIIDFNTAMNPFSAYNDKFSSVLPPAENTLLFAPVSGERKYEHREM